MFEQRFGKAGEEMGRLFDRGVQFAAQEALRTKERIESIRKAAQDAGLNKTSIEYLLKNENVDYRYFQFIQVDKETGDKLKRVCRKLLVLWLMPVDLLEQCLEELEVKNAAANALKINKWVKEAVLKGSQYQSAWDIYWEEKAKPRVYKMGEGK